MRTVIKGVVRVSTTGMRKISESELRSLSCADFSFFDSVPLGCLLYFEQLLPFVVDSMHALDYSLAHQLSSSRLGML